MAPDPVSGRPDRSTDASDHPTDPTDPAPIVQPTEALTGQLSAGADSGAHDREDVDAHHRADAGFDAPDREDADGDADSLDRTDAHTAAHHRADAAEAPLESAEELADELEPVPTLVVEGAGLRGTRGWVYRNVSFSAHTGAITTLTGPSGSGRSTLLLACAGRLRLTEGSVAVHTHNEQLVAVRDRVNVARIAGVIGLDPELSVTANVNDAADWARLRRAEARDLLATWRSRLDLALPSSLPAGELGAPELTLLHLLCATLGEPRAIVLDDLDADLTIPQIAHVWKLTAQIAAGRVSAPTAVVVSTVAALPPGGDGIVHLDAPEGADA